jgi:hypothetical protein
VIIPPRYFPVSPHQLRRIVGTLLSRNDAQLTADTLGHRGPATTVVGAPVDTVVAVARCGYAIPIAPRDGVWIPPLWGWCTPRLGAGSQRWGWVSPAADQRGHKTRRLRPATRWNHSSWLITAGGRALQAADDAQLVSDGVSGLGSASPWRPIHKL